MKKAAGVMGFPISHSLSPRLHGYWINKYDLDAVYVAREVKPEELRKTLQELPKHCAERGEIFRGGNLTIPLKETALDIVDILEPSAKIIGAVNTLVLAEDGTLIGRNTDGIGFQDSLAEQVTLKSFKAGTALVLGAGGAAKAIVHALTEMGFGKILISNRTQSRADELVEHVGGVTETLPWNNRTEVLGQVDLLVNTTSLGMSGQPVLQMSLEGLKQGAVVTDIVYVPLETDLLRDARKKGHVSVDGLGMLLHQAKAGFEAWFGIKPEVDKALRDYVLEGLNKK